MRNRLIVLALSLAMFAVPAAASGHDLSASSTRSTTATSKDPKPLGAVDKAWWKGDDRIVEGRGSSSGYTVYVGLEAERYAARPIATIRPNGDDGDDWIGYLCVTGDGTHAIVNLAQRASVNKAVVRDRGGLLYAVRLSDGAVTPLAGGTAFKYHAVGCGAGDEVAFVRHLGDDQERSQVFLGSVDGGFRAAADVTGQITSPVPAVNRVIAARGRGLVSLANGRESSLVRVKGDPYRLVPNGEGGVDLLLAHGKDAQVARWTPREPRLRVLADGPGSAAPALSMGLHGKTFASGVRAVRQGDGFSALPGATRGVAAVSLEGRLMVGRPTSADPEAEPQYTWARTGAPVEVTAPSGSAGRAVTRVPAVPRVGGSAGRPAPFARPSAATVSTATAATPACGVPRNQPNRQAYSATNTQSAWAVEMASRNLLKGSFVRPANYLQSGLPSYSPSSDFPVPTLRGSGGYVPPAVMNGVLAQESAYRHASRRTLPGNGGNPLVADYYGAAGTVDKIDYSHSDCGYGIAQVTSGMTATDGSITANGKAKIAIDYAENIQAGLNILAKKWNQLYDAGIRVNDSNPSIVENWYAALWAYNSGVQPTAKYGNTTGCIPSPTCTDAEGHWGLGWTNNPANPDYPPFRGVFLRGDYTDAERPSEWPYQERVLGWAETPIFNYKGERAYDGTQEPVTYPDRFAYCSAANECDPTLVNQSDPSLSYCTRVDNRCWWHQSVTTNDCTAGQCAASPFTVSTTAPEPPGDNPWPPECNSDLGSAAIIVDELPDPSRNLFCPSRNWVNKGSFSYTVGTTTASDGSQLPIGEIDFHQIAAGLGSHTWFTGNRLASDTAHQVTGTWTPTLPTTPGPYLIKVHIPRKGSSTGSATYKITLADGSVTTAKLNQHEHYDHWKTLGVYQLGPGSKVVLTNVTDEVTGGAATVAFDAMAFIPAPGVIKRTTVDSVAYFDEDTNIDTDPASSILVNTTLESRQRIYDWANGLTTKVLSYPECSGSSAPMQCVRPATRQAFQRWANEVSAAGTSNAITKWIGFANPAAYRPTSNAMVPAFRTDDKAYKIRQRATVSYVLNGGQIVEGTGDADYDERTADTHLPRFFLDIARAIESDYGVAIPNLSYSAENFNEHDHQVRSVDPRVDGRLPGIALPTAAKKATPIDSCIAVLFESGGSIGYRGAIGTGYVPSAVEGWKNRIKDLAGWYPPNTLEDWSSDFYETFFQVNDVGGLDPNGSPFNDAPPIWQQLDFRFCADGTVKSEYGSGYPILQQSWMPNGYLYRDGTAITQSGSATSSAAPLFLGDFDHFSTEPFSGRTNAYGDCDADTDRGGNPWGVSPTFQGAGHEYTSAHFCRDASLKTDPDYE